MKLKELFFNKDEEEEDNLAPKKIDFYNQEKEVFLCSDTNPITDPDTNETKDTKYSKAQLNRSKSEEPLIKK